MMAISSIEFENMKLQEMKGHIHGIRNSKLRVIPHGVSRGEAMARDWSLQETRALVEEHIALKEQEKIESQTASEHWNKISKKLREKGFYRSYKSCNKRWYRLEQYEVQIFSFNMEEGKLKNYWDLTRFERLEYQNKWPQLPLGDGIDKEMFDLLRNFSRQYEKKDKLESTNTSSICVDDKELIYVKPNIEVTRQSILPLPLKVASPHLTPRLIPHTTIVNKEEQSERQVGAQRKSANDWPSISEQPLLSSQETLDGFKLQARELRKRRAIEFRKNNRTVPYNSTHTTFMKESQPSILSSSQISPLAHETTKFGSITMIPPLENTLLGENIMKNFPKDKLIQTKPPIQLKKLFNTSSKMETNQTIENKNSNRSLSIDEQQIRHQLNFQPQNSRPIDLQQNHLLQSINSHLPLLQPIDNHFTNNKNGANLQVHPIKSNSLPQDLCELDNLEEKSQAIMGLETTQICEQQLHKNTYKSNFGQINSQPLESQSSSSLGVAIGGLGMQLEAIAKLLQIKQASEQEFQEKMLHLVESIVVSMNSMAQVDVPTST